MENKKNIYQRILAIMAEVDYIQKGVKRVNNMYRYVSHDKVNAIFHPQFVKHGIVVLPSLSEITQDGNRTNVLVDVKFINVDNPEDCFSVTYAGYGVDGGDKGPGKAFSYACKLALLKTFCLETGEDPDHDQKVKYQTKKEIQEIQNQKEPQELEDIPITSGQKAWALARVKKYGIEKSKVENITGVGGIDSMLQSQLYSFKSLVMARSR
jgi:hypothetical protein